MVQCNKPASLIHWLFVCVRQWLMLMRRIPIQSHGRRHAWKRNVFERGSWKRCPLAVFFSLLCFSDLFYMLTCVWTGQKMHHNNNTTSFHHLIYHHNTTMWLNGSVVSAPGIRTPGPRFDSRVAPLFHWVATLGKLFTHIASAVSQLQETGVQKGVFGT